MSDPAPRRPRPISWAWLALPAALAGAIRLYHAGDAGPFVDEGANILTSLDPRVAQAFEPLAQGRPWLAYLFRPAGWLPGEALAVARGMAAAAGVATTLALAWTLHRLADRRAAICGLWLWALLPFAVFHERLALQDPFVTALLAVSVALMVRGQTNESARPAWPWFLLAGLAFGCAFLLKVSAAVSLPWIAVVYLTVQWTRGRPLVDRRLGLILLGAGLPLLCLGAGLWHLGNGLDRYSAFPSLHAEGYFAAALSRARTWLAWYAGYDGWPLALLLGAGGWLAYQSRNRLALGCAAAALVAFVVSTLCYHNLYARYILSDHLPLVLFVALALAGGVGASRRAVVAGLVVLLAALVPWARAAWSIAANPEHARVPAEEIQQYFTGPWSGRGIRELNRYLTDYADRQHVRCVVITHRFLRPGCYGLMLAELGEPRLTVLPFIIYEPAELRAVFPMLLRAGGGQPTAYFYLCEGSLFPVRPWLDAAGGPTRRVHEIDRGGGETFTLYQVTPD